MGYADGSKGKGRGGRAEGGAEGAMTLGMSTRLKAMRTGMTNGCSCERLFGSRGGQRGSLLRVVRHRGQPNFKFLSSPFVQIDLSKPLA